MDEYEDMQFEDDGAMSPEGEESDLDEEIDAEFAMHAAEAGFDSPEKQKALKMAIERCYAMKDEAMGEEEVADENLDDLGALDDDEDPLAALA